MRLSEPQPKYHGPPPQCVDCARFVNVKTAQKIPEHGDFGVVLSMEYRCEGCARK